MKKTISDSLLGAGTGLFEPDAAVTREEMVLVMRNYARVTGFSLQVTRTKFSFTDHESMGSEAKVAVIAIQEN